MTDKKFNNNNLNTNWPNSLYIQNEMKLKKTN